MRYRIARRTVQRMVESSGVRNLDGTSEELAVWRAVADLSAVAQGLPYYDRARVYAVALEHFETLGINPPDILEDLMFDPIVCDVAQFCESSARTPGEPRTDEVVDTMLPDDEPEKSKITIKRGRKRS